MSTVKISLIDAINVVYMYCLWVSVFFLVIAVIEERDYARLHYLRENIE